MSASDCRAAARKSRAGRFLAVGTNGIATTNIAVGTGKKARKSYFPHIVVDFDLKTAMRQGLVKSLVLDKRSEIGALSDAELEFKAYRDENGTPQLSEGQRIMLRAGLTKLRKLEGGSEVAAEDKAPAARPKTTAAKKA